MIIWMTVNIDKENRMMYTQDDDLYRSPFGKVRMEAPEIFRVLGKRRAEFVRPYMEQLQRMAETDHNRVVRIHCQGAIKAAER